LSADLDRRFAVDNMPDRGRLLANLVRWAANDRLPVQVEGPGLIDCRLYQQPGRFILHLVNLTTALSGPADELIPIGPITIRFPAPPGHRLQSVRRLVRQDKLSFSLAGHRATMVLPSLVDHEVLVMA